MTEQHRADAARQGAWFFVLAGALVLANNHVFPTDQMNRGVLAAAALVAIAAGVAMRFLPFRRWPDRALLVPALLAIALVAVGTTFGGVSDFSYSLYFVVVATWVGLAQPPGTVLLLTPVAVVAYLLPLLLGREHPYLLESLPVAIPVCILVGELVSRQVRRLHDTTAETARLAGMLRLVASSTPGLDRLDVDTVLSGVLRRAVDLGFASAHIVAHDAVGEVELRGSAGLGVAHDVDHATSALHRAIEEARVSVIPLIPGSAGVDPSLVAAGVQSVVTVPLAAQGDTHGALVATSREALDRRDHEVEALELLALQAENAMGNAQRFSTEQLRARLMQEISLQDVLTGVGNRRYGTEVLADLHVGDLVVIADLDHFKRVNDTDGHAAGDALLQAFARHLEDSLRTGDAVARWGGEEFLLVLRASPAAAPLHVAQRLLDGWRDGAPVTAFSAGAAVHRPGESPETTLKRADDALYRAKAGGRDRLVTDATIDADGRGEAQSTPAVNSAGAR